MKPARFAALVCALAVAGCARPAPHEEITKVVLAPDGSIMLNGKRSSRADLGGEAARLFKAGGEIWLAPSDPRTEVRSDRETPLVEMLLTSYARVRFYTDPTFRTRMPWLGAPGTTFDGVAKEFGVGVQLPPYWTLIDMAAGENKAPGGVLALIPLAPTGEVVMIGAFPAKGRSVQRFMQHVLKSNDIKSKNPRPIKICNGTQDGVYADVADPPRSKDDLDLTGFAVFTGDEKMVVSATYLHFRTMPENADVRTGLENLCRRT